MTSVGASSNRADQLYRDGPERLTARSAAIVAGPVANYTKQVTERSNQRPDGVPLKWVAAGQVDQPETIKGRAAGSMRFRRPEQVGFLPEQSPIPEWQTNYGEFGPGDSAVIFLVGEPADAIIDVVPSGSGERDLKGLVRDIAAIQARPASEREAAWIAYLDRSSTDEGKKAAIRSLLDARAEWAKVAPGFERLLWNPQTTSAIRAFAFGAAAFGVTEEEWKPGPREAVDFLARIFETESNPRQALQYILTLKLVLQYADEEAARKSREPLRRRVFDAMSRRAASIPLDAALRQQYEQIRAAHPGQF